MTDGNYTGAEHTYVYATIDNTQYAPYRYQLPDRVIDQMAAMVVPFSNDAYRESTFLNNYSRLTTEPLVRPKRQQAIRMYNVVPYDKGIERKERWIDVVIRVIEGTMSFYISHNNKNRLEVNLAAIDSLAEEMALTMFKMEWCPPGRGLFAMGSEHTYRNGNSSLNNCYACTTNNNIIEAASWTFDQLACGGGVGFDLSWRGEVRPPNKEDYFTYIIPDTRQGWCSALELLMRSYIPLNGVITNKFPHFDYSLIRAYGAPIKGFGGTASGPDPLRVLLSRVEIFLDTFLEYKNNFSANDEQNGSQKQVDFYLRMYERLIACDSFPVKAGDYSYDSENMRASITKAASENHMPYSYSYLILDIFNCIGCCIHAGNVRRSAMIALGDPDDISFIYMKDWERYCLRRPWMGFSNNTIRLWNNDEFEKYLPVITERIRTNGEPGIANMINIQKYGRFSCVRYGPDKATLLNPCGETCMEDKENCCLASIIPPNCVVDGAFDDTKLSRAAYLSMYYTLIVTTIPHSWSCTNKVISRNRRVGISLAGVATIFEQFGYVKLVALLRKLYYNLRDYNKEITSHLGIPPSIRITVMKPEGTLSIITGVSPGVHYPIISQGCRRIAFDNNNPVLRVLREAGLKIEASTICDTMSYVKFPLTSGAKNTSRSVSAWQKIALAYAVQRYYTDNSVSFTLDFDAETEGSCIENILSIYASQMKCISAFPQYNSTTNQYKHLPFEQLSDSDYLELKDGIRPVDWNQIYNPNICQDLSTEVVSGCTNDYCEIKRMPKS